jgi:dolichol-phosphate mannosyltransferase
MTSDLFISVILPCYNMVDRMAPTITATLEILTKNYAFYEIVIVDDGSSDGSVKSIEALLQRHNGLRLLRMSKRHGVDVAVSAGIDTAIGDFVIVLDPTSDPPDLIPELVRRCDKLGGIHYGVGQNTGISRSLLSPRNLGARIFRWYCRRYLQIDIQHGPALLRVFDRSAVNTFIQLKDRHRPLRLMTAHLGQTLHVFPYEPIARSRFGRDGISGFDEINLAFDILSASSRHPLRWVSRLGLIAASLNVVYAFYVAAIFIFKPHVAEGWVTLSLQNAGMFFFLFLLLTVLSEYVGKILVESQDRPRYTVLGEQNSSVLVDPAKRRNIATQSVKEES